MGLSLVECYAFGHVLLLGWGESRNRKLRNIDDICNLLARATDAGPDGETTLNFGHVDCRAGVIAEMSWRITA